METQLSVKVAFQGVEGAYSEQALYQHFGVTVTAVPHKSFLGMFRALENHEVDRILLPVENSFAGSVQQSYELLLEHDFRIQAEVIFHVNHALLVNTGTIFEDIEYVQSHPQALAQCERFIRRYKLQSIEGFDTAGSAKQLSEFPQKNMAVIASTRAAEIYNLEVLDTEIEDVSFNYTRFLVLGHEDAEAGAYNKTSIVFATRHKPAALYTCLGIFAKYNINLTKLESRPRRNRPWEPVFCVDFEGHWKDQDVSKALIELIQHSSFVKMLGSYPGVARDSAKIGI